MNFVSVFHVTQYCSYFYLYNMAYSSVSLPYIRVNINLQNKKTSRIKTQGKLIAKAT